MFSPLNNIHVSNFPDADHTNLHFSFRQVKYLDSLDLQDIEVNQDGTRVTVWTNAMVKNAIIQDRRSDETFGKVPVCV